MDFPPDPFLPLLSQPYYNPFVISLSTFPLLFTPQSIVIARCSLFRFNSHLVVRSFLLRSPVLHLCLFFIYFWFFAFSSSYFVSLPSVLLRLGFFSSRFSLACRFPLCFPPRTKSVNSFASLTPFTSLPFFRFHAHLSKKPHSPQILSLVMSYLILPLNTPLSSLPHPYFIPCRPLWSSIHLSPPFPKQFPYIRRTSTAAHKYPIRDTMLLPDLHPLMFSSLFPFVNPYQPEGVNQATPDSLDLLLSEGGARSCTPSRPNYLVLARAGFAIY